MTQVPPMRLMTPQGKRLRKRTKLKILGTSAA